MTGITAGAARDALDELIEELGLGVLPRQGQDEYTVAEFAKRLQITPGEAKAILDGKVQSGQLMSRQVRTRRGRRATAYRGVQHGV